MQSNAVDVLWPQIPRGVQRRVAKLRSISGIKRDEKRGGERGGEEKKERRREWEVKESGEALCFLALMVPRSRTTGGHVAKRAGPLSWDRGPYLSFSLACPDRSIVANRRIVAIQCARTRVPNRLGCLKPICASDESPAPWRFAIIRRKIFTDFSLISRKIGRCMCTRRKKLLSN